MSHVDRRSFLALLGVGGLAGLQDSVRGAADPLSRPDVVGATRRVVDSAQNDPVVVGIERRLGCTCPCGLDIFTCRTTDFTCSYSPALHDEVVALLARLGDPEAVVAAFVEKYGEEVLMAPKASGFGVLGYLLPGVAIATAGGVLAWVLIARSRRMAAAAAGAAPSAPVVEAPSHPAGARPDELARLDRALRDLET